MLRIDSTGIGDMKHLHVVSVPSVSHSGSNIHTLPKLFVESVKGM